MNFPWGLKETVSSEKYILQPRAHNSILPMSVDTLPLKFQSPLIAAHKTILVRLLKLSDKLGRKIRKQVTFSFSRYQDGRRAGQIFWRHKVFAAQSSPVKGWPSLNARPSVTFNYRPLPHHLHLSQEEEYRLSKFLKFTLIQRSPVWGKVCSIRGRADTNESYKQVLASRGKKQSEFIDRWRRRERRKKTLKKPLWKSIVSWKFFDVWSVVFENDHVVEHGGISYSYGKVLVVPHRIEAMMTARANMTTLHVALARFDDGTSRIVGVKLVVARSLSSSTSIFSSSPPAQPRLPRDAQRLASVFFLLSILRHALFRLLLALWRPTPACCSPLCPQDQSCMETFPHLRIKAKETSKAGIFFFLGQVQLMLFIGRGSATGGGGTGGRVPPEFWECGG